MADRLYTGPVNKQLRGNREDARRLEREARTKVGYLFDAMRPGETFKTGSWSLGDGRRILAFVWNDVLGKRALIRLTGIGINRQRSWQAPCGFIYVPLSDDFPGGPIPPEIDEFFPTFYEAYWHNTVVFDHLADPATAITLQENVTNKSYGNVDWISYKGEILSFWGPLSRYFYYTGWTSPGGEGMVWDFETAPPDVIFIGGAVLHESAAHTVQGVCFYRNSETAALWLVFTAYRNSSNVESYVDVYAVPVTLVDGVYTAGIETLVETIATAGTWPSWGFAFMWSPRTITAFNYIGTEGSLVLCSGDIVTLTVSGGTDDEDPPAISSDIERFVPVGNNELTVDTVISYYGQSNYVGFDPNFCNSTLMYAEGGGTQLNYTGPEYLVDELGVPSLRAGLLADGALPAFAYLYDQITEEWIADRIRSNQIPLAIDYAGMDKRMATMSSPFATISVDFAVTTGNYTGPGDFRAYTSSLLMHCEGTNVKLVMPTGQEHQLHYSWAYDVQYQRCHQEQSTGGPCRPRIVPSITTIKAKEASYATPKGPSCIRYLDLRRNAVLLAFGAHERVVVDKTITPNYGTPDIWEITDSVTTTTKEPMRLLLKDNCGPDWAYTQQAPAVSVVAGQTIVDVGLTDCSGPPSTVKNLPEFRNDYSVTTAIDPQYQPVGIDGYVYTGGEGTDTADPGYQQIAYNCFCDRIFSIAPPVNDPEALDLGWTGYWDTTNIQNQWWYSTGEGEGELVNFSPYWSMETDGTNPRLWLLAPINVVEQSL